MGFPRLPKARGLKLAAILAAAYVGAVLLVLSAGSGLEPILRPLLPSDDQAVDFEVQVRHDPAPPPPPPAREQPVRDRHGNRARQPPAGEPPGRAGEGSGARADDSRGSAARARARSRAGARAASER